MEVNSGTRKKVAMMGYHDSMLPLRPRRFEEIMAVLGYNTGNLAFWHAVDHQITDEKVFVGVDSDSAKINRICQALVLPAANFLGRHMDLTPYTNFLSRIDIPLYVVGLGIQFELDDQDQQTSPSTEEFISLLKEKDATIAVRGESTAEFLSLRGLKNVVLTGCPSNYINAQIQFRYENLTDRVLLNFQIGQKYAPILPIVGNWADGTAHQLIWQGYEDPIAFLHDTRNIDADLMSAFNDCLRPGLPQPQFRNWLFKNSAYFLRAREWMEYCSRFTLSIGTRFHGNMLALQAGVPAIFVVHDKRTQEMVDLFHLPHMPFDRMRTVRQMDRVLAAINADMNPYLKARRRHGNAYFSMLRAAGISTRPEFEVFTT